MLRDLVLVLLLDVRHGRTAFVRLSHMVGTDVLGDRGALDRSYQAYIALIFGAWLALVWALLLEAASTLFGALDAASAELACRALLLLPAAAFARAAARGMRAPVIKLSHPDIAYVASSRVRTDALAAAGFAKDVLLAALVGGMAGYLAGFGLLDCPGVLASPLDAAALAAASLAAASAAGQLVGIVRLSIFQPRDRAGRAGGRLAVALLAAAAVAVTLAACLPAAFADPFALVGPHASAGECAVLAAAVLASAAVVLARARRIDMAAVIAGNALHADLQPFGPLSPLDSRTVEEHRRRLKAARRRPRFRMPAASGRRALVSRAALSHARQCDGLPALALHGLCAVPLGACAILGVGGPAMYVFWLQALVMMPQGVREATRAFRDDMRNRLVRDRLPFGTLELLALDGLPAFALTSALGCVSLAFLMPGASPVLVVASAVLVNACSMLSCGLDAVRLFPRGPRACYEYGAILLAGVSFALSLFAPLWAVLAAVALACAGIAAVVHRGPECAR